MNENRILRCPLMGASVLVYALIAVVALSGTSFGQDQERGSEGESGELGIGDPILLKLLQDFDKLKVGLEAARKPVREELQRRKEVAQKTGVLRKLEEATQDIAAFESSDKLPATLMAAKPELTKQFRKGKEQAQEKMIRDYEAAIKAYTHEDKIAEANVVKERLETFKASLRAPPPARKLTRRRR